MLVLGTHNKKKRIELEELLKGSGIRVATLDDFPQAIEVVEDGDTFEANAGKKASQQAIHLGQWVLAEDSGLVVPSLGGQPGVLSARYSDPGATDERNNEKLLAALEGKTGSQRDGYYICFAALSDPQGNIVATGEGRCHGRLRSERSGVGGFGYDPLFEVREYHRTFGELAPAVKRVLSHRGRAMRLILPMILHSMQDAPG